MHIVSVQVGPPRERLHRGRSVWTAIDKEPVRRRLRASRLGLEGDAQADLRVHGGPEKAVYAYDVSGYEFWREELGTAFAPGQFGENLTVEGLPEREVRIGDVYRVGGALLQVTQPRGPCFKLALKMERPSFPRAFLRSRRTGFYLRVREEGEIGAGDAIFLVSRLPAALTVEAAVGEIYGV